MILSWTERQTIYLKYDIASKLYVDFSMAQNGPLTFQTPPNGTNTILTGNLDLNPGLAQTAETGMIQIGPTHVNNHDK